MILPLSFSQTLLHPPSCTDLTHTVYTRTYVYMDVIRILFHTVANPRSAPASCLAVIVVTLMSSHHSCDEPWNLHRHTHTHTEYNRSAKSTKQISITQIFVANKI